MSVLQLTIPYKAHPTQKHFHQSKARYRVLSCGRRWGKTRAGAAEAVKRIADAPPESVAFIIAPTYGSTSLGRCWREFLRYCPKEIIKNYPHGIHRTRGDMYVEIIGERYVYFKSADHPDTLAGEGLVFVWLDEPAQMKEEVWERILPPALIDKHGIAWFTGTPKGKNWYFRLYTRGQDPLDPEVDSWNYSSYENTEERGGYLQKKEIDAIANRLPKRAMQQEILGLFIEDVGSVFRKVESCIDGSLEAPLQVKHYVMGADLAKYEDFTVLAVLDDRGHLCAWDRFGELDWVFQRRRMVQLCQQYNTRLLIDSTGVGDPILDALRRDNIRVEGYKFTSASKADLIENLSMMIEQQKIPYPDIPELINELKLFGYTQTKGGTTRYGAPEGYHDDCVIALALAAWQLQMPKSEISFLR